MNGDALARGARSAVFGPAKVTQKQWDAIWAEEKPTEIPSKETTLKTKAKVNG